MHPLKTYYNEEIRTWLANHKDPVRVVTHYQMSELLDKVYMKAATMETDINGFKKTGIYPLNRNVFHDHDFLEETVDMEISANISESSQKRAQFPT